MLRDSDYQVLVEQAPMIIWRADTTGKCDYFNERWLQFTGRTMAQELGDGWAEGVHPDDLKPCLDIYLSAFARRETFEMEYRLRRSDGAYRWILDRGTPSFAADGTTFLGFIGSCVDVHDRRAAQAEVERLHAKEVAELKTLLPVCVGCKRIRDDQGYWQAVDTYLMKTKGQLVSHGLCSACAVRLYPDVASVGTGGPE